MDEVVEDPTTEQKYQNRISLLEDKLYHAINHMIEAASAVKGEGILMDDEWDEELVYIQEMIDESMLPYEYTSALITRVHQVIEE